jgi:hypothetical protein
VLCASETGKEEGSIAPRHEDAMALKTCAAGFCAAMIAAVALPSAPAEAATKKPVTVTQRTTVVDARGRARTRITVAPRSFLDPGTEPIPGESKQLDYALPLGYSPLQVLGPGRDFRRQPLLDPWDFPGARKN